MSDATTISTYGSLEPRALRERLPGIVRDSLPPYLVSQRWFGDKARTITRVSAKADPLISLSDALAILLIVEIAFDQGDSVDYFVPLIASARGDSNPGTIATFKVEGATWSIVDAIHSPAFRNWMLNELGRGVDSATGTFRWSSTPALQNALSIALPSDSRISSSQQSNSSIIYGTSIILKVFRRLSPGINPEIELGRFLTTRTAFRNIPLLLGDWVYRADNGPPVSLAVAQTFIASVADGWTFTLDSIRTGARNAASDAARLGELTAHLHLAFESARDDGDLAPEIVRAEDAASWQQALLRHVDSTVASLRSQRNDRSDTTHDLTSSFLALAPGLAAQARGFDRLIGCTMTRVHGDFHLGQTLRTIDGDFVFLDFEGEPQRAIAERRAKTSPLKDVAGMLRSFGYARGAIEHESPDTIQPGGLERADLVAWERTVRRAFLSRYLAESRRGGARYLPSSDDDVRQALVAWELDKALYEVNYELNNRPDWLPLPLAAALKLAS